VAHGSTAVPDFFGRFFASPDGQSVAAPRLCAVRAAVRFTAMLMLCPICAGEFNPRDKSCPHCGCALVPSALNSDARTGVATINREPRAFAELCRPNSHPIALMIKETLEQNGVAAIVQGGYALSVQPHLAFGGELRVLVDAAQLDFARELYRSFFESDDDIDYITEDLD